MKAQSTKKLKRKLNQVKIKIHPSNLQYNQNTGVAQCCQFFIFVYIIGESIVIKELILFMRTGKNTKKLTKIIF